MHEYIIPQAYEYLLIQPFVSFFLLLSQFIVRHSNDL